MAKVLTETFDLLIVDVNMPRMDGFAFVRSLRCNDGEIATLPALMISTESEEQDFVAARAAGANFYLVKPVAEADLVRHVDMLTGDMP
jgi:two-component system, chemotaxis family, chemotaxis protein CheY